MTKEKTQKICYESSHNHIEWLKRSNEKIEMDHVQELEDDALKIVKKWLKENS